MGDEKTLLSYIKGKKVLFIATKNKDYIRIQQEIDLIHGNAIECDVIVSDKKSYLHRIIEVYRKLLLTSCKKYDVIFVGFMAQMIIPLFNWKWRKKIVITDFFISIFDTLVDDRKKFLAKSIPSKIVKIIDEITIQKSSYIVTDTKAHARYFVNELNASESKCIVLYLKADNSIYYPRIIQKPEKYKDKFVVLYFGSILPLQGVEYVLDAIRLLQDKKDIHFIMIGPIGDKYSRVESDTVTYIEWLTQEKLAEYIAFSDLCLGGHFHPTIGKATRTIPGKVYIYKNMNKKVILGDSLANHELYQNDQFSIFVKMGNGKILAETIINVYTERVSNINEVEFCSSNIQC